MKTKLFTAAGAGRAAPVSLTPIGHVKSPYSGARPAPHQADQGALPARLVFDAALREGFKDVKVGDDLLVLTYLDRSRRDVLSTRPQDNPALPLHGVFSTRSPDRPNPIGLHRVRVTAMHSPIDWEVDRLEAFDGTPILDVKPALQRLADA